MVNAQLFKHKFSAGKNLILFLFLLASSPGYAQCKNPAPHASAFPSPGGGCPSGYYPSGSACAPSSSAKYAFSNPGGGGCPNGYYPSGNACVASSDNSCNAFYSGGGSCPSGYYPSGKSCAAN